MHDLHRKRVLGLVMAVRKPLYMEELKAVVDGGLLVLVKWM
jgi:hypothetical protein